MSLLPLFKGQLHIFIYVIFVNRHYTTDLPTNVRLAFLKAESERLTVTIPKQRALQT